jgi:AbrB family looped-hinge helix DNA binding protein
MQLPVFVDSGRVTRYLTAVLPNLSKVVRMEKTRLSSKGQVVLPKAMRQDHDWPPGTEFSVEEFEDGVLLRPLKQFQPTRVEDVFGCLRYEGPSKTLAEMERAIAEEVRRRHAGGRY